MIWCFSNIFISLALLISNNGFAETDGKALVDETTHKAYSTFYYLSGTVEAMPVSEKKIMWVCNVELAK